MRRCKPPAAFEEDDLAMAVLVGDSVKSDGEDAVAVVAVQRRQWPVVVLPIAGSAPPLDRLGLGCRWGVWRLR